MILIKAKDFSFTLEVFKDYTNSGLQKVFPSLYGYGASSGCGFWEWSFILKNNFGLLNKR